MDSSSKSSSKTSSKASSREQSPANTIRGIPSGLFNDIPLDKILDNLEILLEDTKLLDIICDNANDFEEFPALLFRFFYVHDKTQKLLRWALEKDINTLTPNELFRGESIATRLFYWQFFGDLGKKFLTSILCVLLEQFAPLNHSVEIDAHRLNGGNLKEAEANLKWIIERLNEFVIRLQDSADLCPLGLRESFMLLKDVVGSKVENSSVFVASVLFLRLICPCLVLPEQYGILDNLNIAATTDGKRGLVIASKLLQSAANNIPWDNRFGSDLVNQFVAEANPLIVNFAAKLINSDIIELGKKVIKASVTPISQSEIKQTHAQLRSFLESRVMNKQQIKDEIDFKAKYQLAMKHYQSPEWKVVAVGPKTPECEYFVSQLKQPGSSIFVCRYSGRFKVKYELVKECVRQEIIELTLDDRVERFEIFERYNERHFDLHVWIGSMFPLSPRDLVYKRKNFEENENRFVEIYYSIVRPDQPPTKKHIRAHADILITVVERDPSDPEFTLYTFIFDMDIKGMVPAFFINKANKDNMTVVEKIAHRIMNLDKAPISPVSSKGPVREERKSKDKKKSKS